MRVVHVSGLEPLEKPPEWKVLTIWRSPSISSTWQSNLNYINVRELIFQDDSYIRFQRLLELGHFAFALNEVEDGLREVGWHGVVECDNKGFNCHDENYEFLRGFRDLRYAE